MQARTIGSLTVSLAGLGCNNFGGRCDEEQTRAVVHAALDAGITFFDTADIYGGTRSEQFVGRALAGRRSEVVIATKFGHRVGDDPNWLGGGSAAWVRKACEASLRRLGTDHIDLYQMHVPDPSVPIEETLGALDELVREGKVREIGNSNFTGEQIDEADAAARARGSTRFVSAQNHYNLLHREPEADVTRAAARHGLGLLPYFPLASGMLTGKYRRGEEGPQGARITGLPQERRARILNDETFDVLEQLEAFAAVRGRSILDLAMSWLATRETVASVIAGATKPDQVRANAAAIDWILDKQELAEIDAITKHP